MNSRKSVPAKEAQSTRREALELAARFAKIGEDPMISVARAELFFDFLMNAGSVR